MKRRGRITLSGLWVPLLLLPVVSTACSKEEEASEALAAIEAEYSERVEAIGEGQDSLAYPGEDADSVELAAFRERLDARSLEYDEVRDEFTPRYETLAEDYWGTAAGLEARLWVMSRTTRLSGDDDEDEEARAAAIAEHADAIFEQYAESPHIGQLAEYSFLFTEEQEDRYIGDLRENSPHAAVRAAAIYFPASRKLARLRYERMRDEDSEEDPEDGSDSRAEIEADLQLLVDEYGDVPMDGSTYGTVAYAHLTAHTEEELAIGQPAPEIIGTDVDGNEMRLSDFLGKVTVIDFWGDW